MKRPTIKGARAIREDLGARGVIVLAFDRRAVSGASYGETKAECDAIGGVLDAIVDRIGELAEAAAMKQLTRRRSKR